MMMKTKNNLSRKKKKQVSPTIVMTTNVMNLSPWLITWTLSWQPPLPNTTKKSTSWLGTTSQWRKRASWWTNVSWIFLCSHHCLQCFKSIQVLWDFKSKKDLSTSMVDHLTWSFKPFNVWIIWVLWACEHEASLKKLEASWTTPKTSSWWMAVMMNKSATNLKP
jgi:hypothetical protein